MVRIIIVVSAFIFASVSSLAAEQAAEEETSPWSGKASFGFLGTSGNTDNSNLNTNFEIGYTAGKWHHQLDAYAIKATEDSSTTAEAYGVGWKTERNLSEHNFLFGRLNYRNDRFSGFRTQFSQTAGYGRRIIGTAAHMLNAEIGAGARQSESADGINEDEVILRAGLNYQWTFSETANFTQRFVIESGGSNTYIESVSAVRARLIGTLALVASYTIKDNSDVPLGTENTDTFSALTLEYAF